MRHERITSFVRSCRSEIRMWLNHYADLFATFDKMLEWRREKILQHPLYSKIPRWAQSEVDAYWTVYFEDLFYNRRLFWTLYLNGVRHIAGPDDHKIERFSDVDAERCDRAYVCDLFLEGTTHRLIVPFDAEKRQQDIDDGLLHADHLEIAKDPLRYPDFKPEVVRYHIGHYPNGGSVRLAKETICE